MRQTFLLRIFALCMAATLLVACSLARTAYDNAVPLLSWYIDDYVELNEAQTIQLRERLTRLHVWHRQTELPEYTRALEDAARRSQSRVNGADILRLYDDGRGLAERFGARAIDEFSDLLLNLDARQVDSIAARFERDNEKFARERIKLAPDVGQRERLDRYVKGLASWLGEVLPAQRLLIEATLPLMPMNDALRLADRRRLQADFISLLRSKPAKPLLVERLRAIVLTPEAGRDDVYASAVRRWREENSQLIARVIDRATPAQRAHLQRKLRGYLADVVAVMSSTS